MTDPLHVSADFKAHLRPASILVIDDDYFFRQTLADLLLFKQYKVETAVNGAVGLEMVEKHEYDLILLDFMMPRLTGKETLERLKANPKSRHIPVIMLSSIEDQTTIVECIRLGAEDFLPKPADADLFYARVEACLVRKQWHDREQTYMTELEAERSRSDRLLLNILPPSIAARLKNGEKQIVDHFDDAAVLFADIVDFTQMASDLTPEESLQILTQVFALFDSIVGRHNLEKIKSMGDSIMLVGGVPHGRSDHLQAVADAALAMRYGMQKYRTPQGKQLQIRIGFHCGPLVAGVLPGRKFSYDLWGDTVNVASRMEASGKPGMIQVTAVVHDRLKEQYQFQERGPIQIKGKGEMIAYFLTGRKA
jgi:adenylate cyclase